jgi:hypothetical protein
LKFGGSAEFGAFDPMTAERIQAYLGHGNIQRMASALPAAMQNVEVGPSRHSMLPGNMSGTG